MRPKVYLPRATAVNSLATREQTRHARRVSADLPQPNQPPVRLMRRRAPERAPITGSSIALFRLGEICNHHCPMCSNSGRPEGHLIATDELLLRAKFLHAEGMRRVVVTGGEPTAHPGFWTVVEGLAAIGMAWDINTNGSRLGEPGMAARCAELGLLRAIVSLHSLSPSVSAEISGTTLKGHAAILQSITELVASGVAVMINCVLTRLSLGTLADFVRGCAGLWGPQVVVKLVFPSTAGKGGSWAGIDLRYRDVADDVRRAAATAAELGMELVYENFPQCTLGDSGARNVARSGFGETHYLEDLQGAELYSIDHIEAWFNAFPESCRLCARRKECPGVAETYLRAHGPSEFRPL